ncbi:MAG: hypothetical protein J6A15_02560 [Clostridia bacterium]|nr:hypothetical protein [Clostridia bacterium]
MSKKKNKKNIEYQLDIERKMAQNPNLEKYDYIFPLSNITSLDEQKIKVEELEDITKIEKR